MARHRIHRFAPALVVLGGLAALTAGCGGDTRPALTKAEVIQRGSAICKAAERQLEVLPAPGAEHPFARGTSSAERRRARRFLLGYADALDASRAGLAALPAPEADRRLLDGYIEDIADVATRLRAASRADAERVERQANEAFRRFERASRQTAAYGFPDGVCGAGAGG